MIELISIVAPLALCFLIPIEMGKIRNGSPIRRCPIPAFPRSPRSPI